MGFPDGGRRGCQSLVQTAGFPYTVITHARARVHSRHMHTPTQAAATVAYLFTLRSRAVTPRANELTPEPSSERKSKAAAPRRGNSGRHERALPSMESGHRRSRLNATKSYLWVDKCDVVVYWIVVSL